MINIVQLSNTNGDKIYMDSPSIFLWFGELWLLVKLASDVVYIFCNGYGSSCRCKPLSSAHLSLLQDPLRPNLSLTLWYHHITRLKPKLTDFLRLITLKLLTCALYPSILTSKLGRLFFCDFEPHLSSCMLFLGRTLSVRGIYKS